MAELVCLLEVTKGYSEINIFGPIINIRSQSQLKLFLTGPIQWALSSPPFNRRCTQILPPPKTYGFSFPEIAGKVQNFSLVCFSLLRYCESILVFY